MGHCKRKQAWVSDYLGNINWPKDLTQLIHECSHLNNVRLSGSGDLQQRHVHALHLLAEACPDTVFWGMTRKPEIADKVNNRVKNLKLLVTVDHTSPDSTWFYDGAMCFGPRMPEDTVLPDDDRILVVFPYHFRGKVARGVQTHPKDCQAVWHKITGCRQCGRCWKW